MRASQRKVTGARFCGNVDHWYSFGPVSETVDNIKKVIVTSSLRKRTYDINMDAIKLALCQCEFVRWSNGVTVNFGKLTGSA